MGKNGQVSESEMEILQVIWDNGNAILFGDLMNALEGMEKSWKPNTVLTFLARLAEKGMIKAEKQGRFNRYIAVVSEGEYRNAQTKSFLDRLYGGDAKNLVSALFKQDYLSREDVRELEQFWNEGRDIDE